MEAQAEDLLSAAGINQSTFSSYYDESTTEHRRNGDDVGSRSRSLTPMVEGSRPYTAADYLHDQELRGNPRGLKGGDYCVSYHADVAPKPDVLTMDQWRSRASTPKKNGTSASSPGAELSASAASRTHASPRPRSASASRSQKGKRQRDASLPRASKTSTDTIKPSTDTINPSPRSSSFVHNSIDSRSWEHAVKAVEASKQRGVARRSLVDKKVTPRGRSPKTAAEKHQDFLARQESYQQRAQENMKGILTDIKRTCTFKPEISPLAKRHARRTPDAMVYGAQKRKQEIMASLTAREEAKLRAFSFQPVISPHARRSRIERTTDDMAYGDQIRKEQARADGVERQLSRLNEWTFQPKLNPTYVRSGNGVNASPQQYVLRLREKEKRKVDKMNKYLDERDESEVAECTFKPVIRDAPEYVKRQAREYAKKKEAAAMMALEEPRPRPAWQSSTCVDYEGAPPL